MYFQEDSIVFLDGNWIEARKANFSLFSQTMHYGFGAFDGMRSYKNAEGCNIFKAKEHFERLIDACRDLTLEIPFGVDELVNIAYKLLKKNKLVNAYVRPLIFMDTNMDLTTDTKVHVFIAAWRWKKYLGNEPLNLMISEHTKTVGLANKINAKLTSNYTNSILASSQAKKLGYSEALMLDINGNISESPAANLFYEKDGELFTPTTDYSYDGITRKTIIELAKQWNIKVTEKEITPEEIYEADYAFLTGTATEVSTISSINGEIFKAEWEDSNAHSLYMMYRQLVMFNEYQGLTIV